MAKFLSQRAELAKGRFPGDLAARRRHAFAPTAAVKQHIADLEISKIQVFPPSPFHPFQLEKRPL